jgi:DMSO/TMAO reductase YedYZ molybdopterin-dependent catalytic subunit
LKLRPSLKNVLAAAFAGGASVVIILAVLLPFYVLFKIEYAPTLVSNSIIERTPPDNAILLEKFLGPLSFPFALMGGIMFTAMIGLIVGLVYAAVRRIHPILAILTASLLMPALLWGLFPIHLTPLAMTPFLATGLILALLTRADPVKFANPEGISRRELLTRMVGFGFGGLILSVIDGFPVFLAALNATQPGSPLFGWGTPAARNAKFPAPGNVPEITPNTEFYVMRKFPTVVPPVSPEFRLVIDGLVDQPLQLSLSEIFAFPRHDVYLTRQCVSNPVGGYLISSALFSGARLAEVLAKAGVSPSVKYLKFYGRDGYEESVPLFYALEHGMIAYGMNGLALSEAHGAPLKIEVPGLYGFKNMKWLTRIEAINVPFQSVWAREGWTETAIYKTMSRIDAVRLAPDGTVTACGIAFAGLRGINKVEVQVNNGGWREAVLHTPPLSDRIWVQWRIDLPERGNMQVRVRATDGTGTPQIATKQAQYPDGASGYHSVTVSL